jgi:hypothetical protein
MPGHVQDWVAETLGSPVVAAADQVGGMSPGCATRLLCEDGTRAFVKAVGLELNPVTPILFRREVTALSLVGSHELWADLMASYDDGDWVAVLLEDVEGEHPDLDDDAIMDQLLRETERLTSVLAERVPDPPAPDPEHGGLADLADSFHVWADRVARAGEVPSHLLPDWVRHDTGTWEPLVRGLADHDRGLVHWDIRNDNLLVRPTGELAFVDWGNTSIGPLWVDPLLARLERVESAWFDASLECSPALAAAGDVAVDAWLVGFARSLAWGAAHAVDVNLPTLNDFRISESRRMLAGAERRLGIA